VGERICSRTDAGHFYDDALRLETEPQDIGLWVTVHATGEVRHRPEMHCAFHPVPAERLAGTEPEYRFVPAPVIQPKFHFGECLCPVGRLNAVLVHIGRNGYAVDHSACVPARRVWRTTSSSLRSRIERSTSTLRSRRSRASRLIGGSMG
jgi:hypothetical protein